jgi:hypothetical protein
MRISALLGLAFVACSSPPPVEAPAPTPKERFDSLIRQDFFDGMRGDVGAMDRAMKLCEDTLAKHPDDPEAMVWHGAGLLARSRTAFRTGDTTAGQQLYTTGMSEMDHAVELSPNNIGVRISRGAVLLAMAPYVPEPDKTRLLHHGIEDYEATLALQQRYFGKLTLHAREQLLYGLTDGYANLGDLAKAQAYYQQMSVDAPGSTLLGRAKDRAAGTAVAGQTPCEQCHGR